MKSKAFGLLTAVVMVLLLVIPGGTLADATHVGSAPDSGEQAVYIVRLADAPLSMYEGGIAGLDATNPAARGENKLDVHDAASVAYLDYLAGQHRQFIATMEQVLDRSVEVLFRYDIVLNGMAARLTGAEAAQVAALPGVVAVQQETIEYPDTDVGPTWIGAPAIWDGSGVPGGVGTKGEGVIVGILDTGINSDHPSFADVGGDGYDHTNPWGSGHYVGYCVANPGFCNDKLIGAYSYVTEAITPEDSDGHGSHTSSTAAGNHIHAVKTTPGGYAVDTQISGVAPHANIIMYDVCTTGCPTTASVAAVNQAVADGVSVINFSISGGNNPYSDSVELAFLGATSSGVFVSCSAGNNGPTPSSVGHRGPWVSTTAAGTHNRLYANSLINMSGGSTTPPADIVGQSISLGVGPRPIVYAGDVGDPLCQTPFPAGTWTNEIVVCDRGINARVDKGANVLAGGADGFVLANDAASGNSLVADPHYLPAIHITYNDGVALKAWLDSGSGHTATITPTTTDLAPINGDIMASFSSRGPNTTFDVLKPDTVTPGVAVFAAYRNTIELEWLGGTSMASPHNAGAAALLSALYPTWSTSEIKSAIMTTANTDNLRKEDGTTPADPFDVGAGRDDLTRAAKAGLVLDETTANYQAANPASGGDPKTLNLPSFQNNNCQGTCSWTRVVKSTQSAAVTWTASGTGMGFTFSPASFSLPAGGTQAIVVTANTSGLPVGSWSFGEVTLTPSDTSIPTAHMPVAVVAQPGTTDPIISVDPTSFDASQAPDTTVTRPLVVSNSGGSDLVWNIWEDGPTGELNLVDWADNFDSYATGSSMHGQGGWKGWFNDPAGTAYTSTTEDRSAPNSVAIAGASDLVHEYSGYTSGAWTYTAWQYIPTDFSGESYFILLNNYNDANVDLNWSTQVHFDSVLNEVANDGPAGGTLPMIKGQWVELRAEIDLGANLQRFYYDGDLLFQGSWTEGMSGGGSLNISAVDLFANAASVVYYDDISLTAAAQPVICDAPSDIPWVSVAPTSGTTPAGDSSTVDVAFDSTGLTVGTTYTGTLCVESNDPATPLVPVPLELTIVSGVPVIDVDPESLTSTQLPDVTVTLPLSVCNAGEVPLTWALTEGPASIVRSTVDGAAPRVPAPGTTGSRGGSAGEAEPIPYNSVADFAEGFDDITLLPGQGWFFQNNSAPLGLTDWFQGNDTVFPAHAGAPTAYIGANFNNTADVGTISNWMLTPEISLNNGDTISFWTRVPTGSSWPDRLELRLSTAGASTNVGTGALDVGDFTTLLLSVNPSLAVGGYPDVWTQFSATLSGIPAGASGRIAFRYFVTGGGPNGSNSNYIGIDTVEYVGASAYDVPWLSEDPIDGVVEPGLCQLVDVSFDSTGLADGDYYANLIADSNDPANPEVVVPVVLTVQSGEPDIAVEPAELSTEMCADETEVVTLTVWNTGTLPLDWTLTEIVPVTTRANSLPAANVSRAERTVELSLDSAPVAGGSVTTNPPSTDAPVSLVLDDGTVENNIGIGGTWEFIYLNRFTPAAGEYPFSLNEIQVYFDSGGLAQVGDNIILAVYENTSGSTDPAVGSNWLASFPTTVQAIDAWNVYDISATPVLLNGPGDVLIGVVALETPGTSYWPAAMDQTATQQRSWAGWWLSTPPPTPPTLPPDDSWTLIDAYFPGNWLIRGYGETAAFDIPWLSENPTSGTVQPGEYQEIAVTFDSTGLTPGDYAGALLVESNDPDTPEITIPVNLTVGQPGVELSPESQTLAGAPGEDVTFQYTLTNTGCGSDSFALSVAGNDWPTSVASSSGELEPGEATIVEVVVSIPNNPTTQVPLADDSFTLTAVSQADPAATAQALGTTVANATPGVAVSADQHGSGPVGSEVSYTFVVTNTGDYTDTFSLSLTEAVWTSTLSVDTTGPLAPGASAEVIVTVDIPTDATPGDTDLARLTAVSTLDPGVMGTTTAETLAVATVAVDVSADQSGSGTAGSAVTYVFLVTNMGNDTDTFNLSLAGALWPSTLSIDVTDALAPGASQTVTVTVNIPAGATPGDSDVVTITATSMADPSVSDSATATTTVTQTWRRYFLPIVSKNS